MQKETQKKVLIAALVAIVLYVGISFLPEPTSLHKKEIQEARSTLNELDELLIRAKRDYALLDERRVALVEKMEALAQHGDDIREKKNMIEEQITSIIEEASGLGGPTQE